MRKQYAQKCSTDEALLTLDERKTRKRYIMRLPAKKAQCVKEALKSLKEQNGLVRFFIPKGKPISQVSDRTITRAEEYINKMPRKIFDYASSAELFDQEISLIYAA